MKTSSDARRTTEPHAVDARGTTVALSDPVEAATDYLDFAARLTASGVLSDPWLEGRPRFARAPLVLAPSVERRLVRAAEELCAAYQELALLAIASPELLAPWFSLTPFQRLMWESSAPLWHGIARADVFVTDDESGARICEINCDTPSGEAEAVLLNRTAHEDFPALRDPNAQLEERFCELVAVMSPRAHESERPLTIGILYPTEITEDLSMIRLYQAAFARQGWRVVLGSPFNLQTIVDGDVRRAGLFGVACDVIVRHYKTDWWGEREPVTRSAPPYVGVDAQPLAAPLGALLGAVLDGTCAVVNPFGSVLLQNKRAMAFLWEERARFSPEARSAIERWLPETVRLETLESKYLVYERPRWVLKSDYGCEGAEVIVGALVSDEEWARAIADAIPSRWVAQRYFDARRDGEGRIVNHGVYLIGGQASGIYSRVAAGPTDGRALSVPTLVDDSLAASLNGEVAA